MDRFFRSYSRHLQERLGVAYRVRKVTLDGGFTCPNLDGSKGRGGCTYCNNYSFSPAVANRRLSIRRQLEAGMSALAAKSGAERFIAYFQPFSNTYAPVARLRELYEEALSHPMVVGLAVGTRPDCLPPETVELLDELSRRTFVGVEIGLQSCFDDTLRRINRGHTFADFARAMDLCQNRGFELCVHVILGLPGESRVHFAATARSLAPWRLHSIKLHPLHVVKGTVLARQYARGEYAPPAMDEYVAGLADMLEWLDPSVAVQRFTGDAPPNLLLAPHWCRDKMGILEALKAEFRRRGTRQGSRSTPLSYQR